MTEILSTVVIACVVVRFIAPRAYEFFDAVVTRRRLHHLSERTDCQDDGRRPARATEQAHNTGALDAATCEALARATRAGLTARQAIEETRVHPDAAPEDLLQLHPLLGAAYVDGNFDPAALDTVAAIIRDRVACARDTDVAIAQASLSVRVLTLLPIGGLVVFALISSRFRSILLSPGMFSVVAIGLVLNQLGRKWMRSLVMRVTRPERDSITSLMDHLCVSLRAGYTLPIACERLGSTGECGRSIGSNLAAGEPLDRALQPLEQHFDAEGRTFADLVIAAHRDGQPLLATIDRLADESRATRRRDTDIRIRELPGKLAAPLVMFVLPSFMLLSIAPLVFISIGRLAGPLPLAQP